MINIVASDEPTTFVRIECSRCYIKYGFLLDSNKIRRWQNGEKIQDVFSEELTVDERELFISGVCGECFDDVFAE